MARVTVEDCVQKVPNRFELVLLASQRARNLSRGEELTIDRDNDKNPVVALREIAEETIELGRIEQDLIRIIPREKWILFSHQIIWHGRRLCIARKPKCVDCALENLCHAADKTWSTVELHKNAKV